MKMLVCIIWGHIVASYAVLMAFLIVGAIRHGMDAVLSIEMPKLVMAAPAAIFFLVVGLASDVNWRVALISLLTFGLYCGVSYATYRFSMARLAKSSGRSLAFDLLFLLLIVVLATIDCLQGLRASYWTYAPFVALVVFRWLKWKDARNGADAPQLPSGT